MLGKYIELHLHLDGAIRLTTLYELSQKKNYDNHNLRMDLIAYSDGKNNLFEIAIKIDKSLPEVIESYKILKQRKLKKILKECNLNILVP